ncbi:MAG: ParB-like nuclease domain-containing protein [Anaerolineae bacterium]|nr:ParB-like nuclease domain-containing protein [Anaerolineae bacterium]
MMNQAVVSFSSEFDQARKQAIFEGWRNFITRQPNMLLSFETVRQALGLQDMVRRGLQDIEIDAIVGSVGRDWEFTRTFLPKSGFTRDRWQQVADFCPCEDIQPILVYKVSNIYFVVDGHHRVSVCRLRGEKTMKAFVIEYTTSVSIDKDDDVRAILQKGNRF